jgi:hypothetical protein
VGVDLATVAGAARCDCGCDSRGDCTRSGLDTGARIARFHPALPRVSEGVFAGWDVHVERDTADIPHVHVWTFGPWSGSFCSNGTRTWNIDWGGQPGGNDNPLYTHGGEPRHGVVRPPHTYTPTASFTGGTDLNVRAW